MQDLLENVFLPHITTAINRLDKVVGKDFVFTITPEMLQDLIGDEDQEPIDIDDTEIYLMQALLHQLRAVIYAAITYNVNVPYYDLIEQTKTEHSSETRFGMPDIDYNWQWLAQDSDFLTIRSGQARALSNAHADLNNVLNSIESAWTFLQNDTDTEYDIITMDMITEFEDDMEEEIDRNINDFLDEAQKVLNEDYTITRFNNIKCAPSYWDEESGDWVEGECGEVTDSLVVTLNIKNFLTSPPQNLKEIIPGYSIATDVCEYEDWDYNNTVEYVNWGCPKLTWEATTCEQWKAGWDVTLGGLFPNMTTENFFGEDMFNLEDEDCEEILISGELDF